MLETLSKLDWLMEGLFTSVLVLGFTLFREWFKERRHYKNLAHLIALELHRNHRILSAKEELSSIQFKPILATEVWQSTKYELSKYADIRLFETLNTTYNAFTKLNALEQENEKYIEIDYELLNEGLRLTIERLSKISGSNPFSFSRDFQRDELQDLFNRIQQDKFPI